MSKTYQGTFKDIDSRNYMVQFYNPDASGGLQTITLAGEPVSIEFENSEDVLYKPVKLSGSTIRLVTNNVSEYYFDLYSSNPKQWQVRVLKADNYTVYREYWVGYITPSLYSQGFESKVEEIEIDCLDCLSILKYYKYTSIGQNPTYRSFWDILMHILSQSCLVFDLMPKLYFMKGTYKNKDNDLSNILRKIYVNESIFFDDSNKVDSEGNRVTEKDDSMLDVLEKMMTYLGMTIYTERGNVYIVDYDRIADGEYIFFDMYINSNNIGSTAADSSISKDSSLNITGNSYAENGQKLSLEKVFNKVTVTDKFKEVGELLPDLFEEKDLTEIYPCDYQNGYPPKLTRIWSNPSGTADENDDQWCWYKVYKNNNYNFYAYNDAGTQVQLSTVINQITPDDPSVNGWPIQFYESLFPGGALPWMSIEQPDYLRSTGQCACIMLAKMVRNKEYDLMDSNTIVPYFDYDKYLLLETNEYRWKNNKKNATGDGTITRRPSKKLVSITPNFTPPFLSGNGRAYLVFTGNCFMEDRYNLFGFDSEHEREKDDWSVAGLVVSLRIGNKWWNYNWQTGAQGTWGNSEVKFRIPLQASDHDHWIGKELSIQNNIPYTWGIDKEGWAIPLPDNVELESGTMEVNLWTPIPPTDDGAQWDHSSYLLQNTWIKNFNVEIHILNEENKESKDNSDTCYTNVINVNNVETLSDINFDICTFDQKTISNNCVYFKNNNGTYDYLDKVYNLSVSPHLDLDSNNRYARFEELLCCRIANQYSQPRIKLEVNLKEDKLMSSLITENILNKSYIIDSKEIDVRSRNVKYTLIEKA